MGERDRGRVRNNNKKMNKNIKQRIFKWSCKKKKKKRMFDVWYIVKWGIKIVKVVF